MKSLAIAIASLGLAIGAAEPAAAETVGTIEKVLRGKIPVFDENLKEAGRIDGKKIRKNHPVTGVKGSGYLKVSVDGRTLFVRRADVKFNGPATCKQSAESRRSNSRVASGTPGMRAGAGSGGVCVPVNR